jgi:hypothetical protein
MSVLDGRGSTGGEDIGLLNNYIKTEEIKEKSKLSDPNCDFAKYSTEYREALADINKFKQELNDLLGFKEKSDTKINSIDHHNPNSARISGSRLIEIIKKNGNKLPKMYHNTPNNA